MHCKRDFVYVRGWSVTVILSILVVLYEYVLNLFREMDFGCRVYSLFGLKRISDPSSSSV